MPNQTILNRPAIGGTHKAHAATAVEPAAISITSLVSSIML